MYKANSKVNKLILGDAQHIDGKSIPLEHCELEIREEVYQEPIPSRAEELGCKCRAKIMLVNRDGRLYVPSYPEWVGLHLLERDDELPERM